MKWTNDNITSQQLLEFLEKEREMSAADVAMALGTTAQFLGRIRNGNASFKQQHIQKLQKSIKNVWPLFVAYLVRKSAVSVVDAGEDLVEAGVKAATKLRGKGARALAQLMARVASKLEK